MCGFVGAVGLRAQPDPDVAERILDSLRHRGPDTGAHSYRDGVWMGSRRLKVLDLRDDANQPMDDPATGVSLVYNGEIYNYVELRAALRGAGHDFRTTGDTEVLLRGYLEWGAGVFARCNGMWACAIDDPRHRRVLLCRDRFGEKPLYVGRDARGAWWFGSEAPTLRLAGAGTGRYDRARVLNFLAFGDAEDPEGSFLEGIAQLPPGHHVLLEAGGAYEPRRWWSLDELARRVWDAPAPPDDRAQSVLDDAVRLRLRSDVPVGSSLSGGVDSSTVVASIRAVAPGAPLHTFTASFPGSSVDEWERAHRVGELFGAEMHRVEPTVDGFLDSLPTLVIRQGGPFDSPSVYAQWCVMHAAADAGVVVLLDGQGADETWGGYPKHAWFALGESVLHADVAGSARLLRTWRVFGGLPAPDPLQIAGLALPDGPRRLARSCLRRTQRWLGPALRATSTVDPQGRKTAGPLLRQAALADAQRVILPRLLRYADRTSMAWSRELRLPYLDERVVETALASGWQRGLQDGWTKARLRRLAARRVPADVAWRRDKTAYDVPDREWRTHPRVVDAVRSALDALVDFGILATREAPVSPWRTLSLACFLDQSRLSG